MSRCVFSKYFSGFDGHIGLGYSNENSICERWLLGVDNLGWYATLKTISCFSKKRRTNSQTPDGVYCYYINT